MEKTSSLKKLEILSFIFVNHENYDDQFEDFVSFNDLGLPLAYAAHEKIIELTSKSEKLIEDTWVSLLEMFEIEDTGFDSIDEILNS